MPNSSCGCSSPVALAVLLLPDGQKYRRYLTGQKTAKALQRSFSLCGEQMTLSCNNRPPNLLNSNQLVHLNLNLNKNVSLYEVLGKVMRRSLKRYSYAEMVVKINIAALLGSF